MGKLEACCVEIRSELNCFGTRSELCRNYKRVVSDLKACSVESKNLLCMNKKRVVSE